MNFLEDEPFVVNSPLGRSFQDEDSDTTFSSFRTDVKFKIENKTIDINSIPDNTIRSIILEYVINENIEGLKFIVNNTVRFDSFVLLHAVDNNRLNVVKFLLTKITLSSINWSNILKSAVRSGSKELIKVILNSIQNKQSIDTIDICTTAIRGYQPEILMLLNDMGFDLKSQMRLFIELALTLKAGKTLDYLLTLTGQTEQERIDYAFAENYIPLISYYLEINLIPTQWLIQYIMTREDVCDAIKFFLKYIPKENCDDLVAIGMYEKNVDLLLMILQKKYNLLIPKYRQPDIEFNTWNDIILSVISDKQFVLIDFILENVKINWVQHAEPIIKQFLTNNLSDYACKFICDNEEKIKSSIIILIIIFSERILEFADEKFTKLIFEKFPEHYVGNETFEKYVLGMQWFNLPKGDLINKLYLQKLYDANQDNKLIEFVLKSNLNQPYIQDIYVKLVNEKKLTELPYSRWEQIFQNKLDDNIKFLIDAGINYDREILMGRAIVHHMMNTAEFLLGLHPDLLNTPSEKFIEKMLNILANENDVQIIIFMRDNGFNIRVHDDKLFIKAVEVGNSRLVTYLISNGVDIHVYEEYPLRIACRKSHEEVVRLLIYAGADVHARSDAALKYAVSSRNMSMEIVKMLVEAGCDLNLVPAHIRIKFGPSIYPKVPMPAEGECMIIKSEINPGEEYYRCNIKPDHIYGRKAMEEWMRGDPGKFTCLMCFKPLEPKIYVNRKIEKSIT